MKSNSTVVHKTATQHKSPSIKEGKLKIKPVNAKRPLFVGKNGNNGSITN